MNNYKSLILNNLELIKKRMTNACDKAGRNINDVKLMLATKTVPVEKIQTAINAGNLLLGENKVKEAQKKYDALDNDRLQWHIIGHLQTNK